MGAQGGKNPCLLTGPNPKKVGKAGEKNPTCPQDEGGNRKIELLARLNHVIVYPAPGIFPIYGIDKDCALEQGAGLFQKLRVIMGFLKYLDHDLASGAVGYSHQGLFGVGMDTKG